ncbi:MAG TPA: hypothetical protein VHC22_13345 [Pirellulales bacterium]|nr:hypothetical protein [Pirellulales bacterium]
MSERFQFSLQALIGAAFAACIVANIGRIVAGDTEAGKISDLPTAERLALGAITAQGITVADRFT